MDQTNSTYSNLMAYLDTYESDATSETNRGGESKSSKIIHRDNPPPSSSSEASGYIWDALDSQHRHISTRRNEEELTSSSSSRIIGEELKSRISSLKSVLKANKDEARELQAEFARLSMVKTRRTDKRRKQIEALMLEQENEQRLGLKKQEDFITKLTADIAAFEEKSSILTAKINSMEEERDTQLAAALKFFKQSRSRTLRQLEAEEKQSIEKIVHSKLAAMNKSAADGFGPKLDEMVRTGKSELAKLTEESDGSLKKLRSLLEAESENKVMELRNKFIGKGKLQVLKEKQDSQTKVVEIKTAYNRDINTIATELETEKSRLSVNAARMKDLADGEADSSVMLIREAQKITMQDLLGLHSEEVVRLAQQLHAERESLRSRLGDEKVLHFKMCRERKGKMQEAEQDRLLMELKQELTEEKDRVISALRIDVLKERRDLKTRADTELAAYRAEKEEDGRSVGESYRDVSQRVKLLRGDVAILQSKVKVLEANIRSMDGKLSSLKRKNGQLTTELAALEEEEDKEEEVVVEDSVTRELIAFKQRLDNELAELENEGHAVWRGIEEDLARSDTRHQVSDVTSFQLLYQPK